MDIILVLSGGSEYCSVFFHLYRNSLTIHGDLMGVHGSRWRCNGCLWIDMDICKN